MSIVKSVDVKFKGLPKIQTIRVQAKNVELDEVGEMALEFARDFAPKVSGKMAKNLFYKVDFSNKKVSLGGAEKYTNAVEYGVKPHVMWQLMGKTIPMRVPGPHGGTQLMFRRATLHSYYNRIVARNPKGQIYAGGVVSGAWRHPGSKGQFFMQRGLQAAWDRKKVIFLKEAITKIINSSKND